MEQRDFKSKTRYFIAFIIATFLFILIISISYYISVIKFNKISISQDELSYSIFEDKLDYTLFNKNICSEENLEKISKDLNFQRAVMYELENKFGKNNENVLFRKKFYLLVQLQHLEYLKTLEEKCGTKTNILFFFYSNNKEEIDESEKWGRILDVYQYKHPNVMVYSFDSDLDSELIKKLKNKYDVSQPIEIIYNENVIITKLNSINDLENYLKN